MKITAAYRYLINDSKKALIIYYSILLGLTVLLGITFSMFLSGPRPHGSEGNINFASFIFLFCFGLNSYKQNFLFSLQSGVSRRTLFCGTLLLFATLSVVTTVADRIIAYISALAASSVDTRFALSIPHALIISFALMTLGYVITILFYRLNRLGKILVGAGVPALCFYVLPLIDSTIAHGAISMAVYTFFKNTAGLMRQFGYFALILLGLAAVFSLLSWIMMRKAALKK